MCHTPQSHGPPWASFLKFFACVLPYGYCVFLLDKPRSSQCVTGCPHGSGRNTLGCSQNLLHLTEMTGDPKSFAFPSSLKEMRREPWGRGCVRQTAFPAHMGSILSITQMEHDGAWL